MRILAVGNMYPPHHLGGYELIWRSNTRALRERGHEVRVLTTDYRRPGEESAAELDPNVHRELRWYWKDDDYPEIVRGAALRLERHNRAVMRRHLREFRPEAIAWWAMGGMSLSLLEQARKAGVPAVGMVFDDWMLYGPRVDRWLVHCRAHPRLTRLIGPAAGLTTTIDLGRSAHWLFCSRHTKSRAVEHGGLPEPSAAVAYAGVDPGVFRSAATSDWGWRLAYIGRLDERKGIHTALDCLSHLPPESSLHIVGGGDEGYEAELRARVERAGNGARVRFEPQVPRSALGEVYAAADVLVFPVTWNEPWGLVPLEAMAVGTPVVATGTGGSGEYLEHERNCLLFERGDAVALADCVRRLGADPELRSRLRSGGVATAAQYTEEHYNQAVETALVEARSAAGE